MADGVLEWWKVETRTASAWRWFMLTLNWSCSIRARSSHMLASDSRRFSTAWLVMYTRSPAEAATQRITQMVSSQRRCSRTQRHLKMWPVRCVRSDLADSFSGKGGGSSRRILSRPRKPSPAAPPFSSIPAPPPPPLPPRAVPVISSLDKELHRPPAAAAAADAAAAASAAEAHAPVGVRVIEE
jgi:hypothetical protein